MVLGGVWLSFFGRESRLATHLTHWLTHSCSFQNLERMRLGKQYVPHRSSSERSGANQAADSPQPPPQPGLNRYERSCLHEPVQAHSLGGVPDVVVDQRPVLSLLALEKELAGTGKIGTTDEAHGGSCFRTADGIGTRGARMLKRG